MAFVPPVPGYARDRARSEAFPRKNYVIQEESDVGSGSRRSSAFATKKTVENTLPAWFETGFLEYDNFERDPFADSQQSEVVIGSKYGYDGDAESSSNAAKGLSNEEPLLARYRCESYDRSQFGDLGRITDSKKGAKVVIRRMVKSPNTPTNNVRREITILSLVTDPSLPSLIEWLEVPDALWTVKSFRQYRTLAEDISLNGPLSDSMLRGALNQLFSGITSLFLAGFAHLRICADTVCLDEQQQIVIKDLHFACVYGKERSGNFYAPTQEKYGSDIYVAPEVFANNTYNARKAVIWSCGVLLYFMITGQTDKLSNIEHPSFETLTDEVQPTHRKMSVAHAKSKLIMYPDRFAVPNYARAIISKMLLPDPVRRAELIEVATRVPKDFEGKAARPLVEIAWVDYKYHVGPYAGLDIGAGGMSQGTWGGGLQSSASSIISAASQFSNPFASLMGKGHARRRSEPVTSSYTRYA